MTNLHTRLLFQIGRSSLIEFEMFELHRIEIFYFIVFCPGFLQVAEQCSQMIFLENPNFEAKKSRKSRAKKHPKNHYNH